MKEAIQSYEKALAADPKNYEAWDNQGYAFVKMRTYKEAHKSIDRSLQIKPDRANGIYNKGYCYACEGKTTLAADCRARAIELTRAKYLSETQTDPDLKPLHKNKRFQKLAGKTFC
jgi:tetratricopeptide (TPR) repeat protein